MTINELSQNLDKAISDYETAAGHACSMCCDDFSGEALSESHKATAHALSAFKAEILTYLLQQHP